MNKLEGGRLYTDHYIKNYKLVDHKPYDQEILNAKYLSKLILDGIWVYVIFLTILNFQR